MSFEYKPVSLEKYNQTLRDSVNAYYTHAMNDPNMSNEDALKSTGEMAEQYLDAVQEFQELRKWGILKQLMKMCQSLIMVWMALMLVWIFKKEI